MRIPALAIGSGWGAHAARAMARDARIQLKGIIGRGSERSQTLARELAVPLFSSLGDAIAATGARIASVAAHETVNPTLIGQLLEADCHVLCSHPVAASAADLRTLCDTASRRGLHLATDYTLRLRPAYLAVQASLASEGALLRLAIETPGRTAVMGVDLALALAGPASAVYAATRYPPQLRERVKLASSSFPPTFLLEHGSGCVTTLVPVPHADPASAYRLVLSLERGRIELKLPSGGASVLRYRGRGAVDVHELSPPELPGPPERVYGDAMCRLVARFVDTVCQQVALHAPVVEEIAVCEVWSALQRSARSHSSCRV